MSTRDVPVGVGTVRTLQDVTGRPAIAVVVLSLVTWAAACGGGQQSAAARATDQRFVDGVHESATDISSYRTDSQLIKMGHVTCDGFRANANIEQIASLLERNAASIPPGDIGAVISTAVHVLCPADSSVVALEERWRQLVGSGADPAAADAALAALLSRWREPHRAYHTTDHLAAVLDRLDELSIDGAEAGVTVRLAAWLHDAVYDPQAGDNEARSAALAFVVLGPLGFDARTIAEVARLVELTAGHRPAAGDTAGAALCDADLAVLAGSPDAYRAYAAAVRREYRHLSDEAFRTGRSHVLADLLARPQLYALAAGRRRWEAAARSNLAAELGALEARQG
jgi:predicted metal-dependent HD superfamily phosphohydrolase